MFDRSEIEQIAREYIFVPEILEKTNNPDPREVRAWRTPDERPPPSDDARQWRVRGAIRWAQDRDDAVAFSVASTSFTTASSVSTIFANPG